MKKLSEFAWACIEQNTTDELIDGLLKPADLTDCKTWGLTPTEYKNDLADALRYKIQELEESE